MQTSITCCPSVFHSHRNLKPNIFGLSSTIVHFLHIHFLVFPISNQREWMNEWVIVCVRESNARWVMGFSQSHQTGSKISIFAFILDDLWPGIRMHKLFCVFISFLTLCPTWQTSFCEFIGSHRKNEWVNDWVTESKSQMIDCHFGFSFVAPIQIRLENATN